MLKKFDPERAKLTTFLRVVASSTAIDWLRRRRPQSEDIDDHAGALADERSTQAFEVIGQSETALQAVEEEIGDAGLSDRQRVILKLMFDEDMDVEDMDVGVPGIPGVPWGLGPYLPLRLIYAWFPSSSDLGPAGIT